MRAQERAPVATGQRQDLSRSAARAPSSTWLLLPRARSVLGNLGVGLRYRAKWASFHRLALTTQQDFLSV